MTARRGTRRVSHVPALSAQWHPLRNNDLRPEDVALGSHRRVWWQCQLRPDHEWQVAPYARAALAVPGACPFCSGQRVARADSVGALKPHIAQEWHPKLNGTLTPFGVRPQSGKQVWWLCRTDDEHVWRTAVSTRGGPRETRCPYCSGRRATASWNLASCRPTVAALLDYSIDQPPSQLIAPSSGWTLSWACPRGPDHRWRAPVYSMTTAHKNGNHGCPYCAGKRVSVTNSVATHPRLGPEYHPTRNALPADQVIAGTNARLWWRCAAGHDWRAQGALRVTGRSSCPWCQPVARSAMEQEMASLLVRVFPDLNSEGDRLWLAGKVRQVDFLIPSERLAIEVDGRFWHRDMAERDIRKSELLAAAGWQPVRLREAPLRPLIDDDCVFPRDADAVTAVRVLLDHLRARGLVEPTLELPATDEQLMLAWSEAAPLDGLA